MRTPENVVPLHSGHMLRNRFDSKRVVAECQYEEAPDFVAFMQSNSDSSSLRSHLSGYPVFSSACTILYKQVGPQWGIGEAGSLMLRAMENAVVLAGKYQRDFSASFTQVQSLLVNALCEKLAQLSNYDTVGVASDGSITAWDVRIEPFSAWAKRLRDRRYMIVSKERESDPNKTGFRVRLMCLALDDQSLGVALHRHL